MKRALLIGAMVICACNAEPPQGACSPTERCGDGIDNDCDGQVDEDCACAPGEVRGCGEGVCAGMQQCEAGEWSACYGGAATAEVCDGIDNDCDGIVDNGGNACGGVCELPGAPGAACDGSDADACAEGTWSCDGLNAMSCSDATGDKLELCGDGVDNNCDGRIDEYCAGATLRWTDHGGSSVPGARAQALDVAVAPDGSVYVAGTHDREVAFGGGAITHDAGTRTDSFLLKYSAAGQLVWHRAITGPGDAAIAGIAVAPDGTIVAAGQFGGFGASSVTFGPGVTRSPVGGMDAFVARYTPAGDLAGVATFASDADDEVTDVAVAPGGDVAITGTFVGASFTIGPFAIPRAGGARTYFIARLDSAFAPAWARRIEFAAPASGEVVGRAVAFDAAGALYAGGSALCFASCNDARLAINRGQSDELALPAGGGFLASYGNAGELRWAMSPAQVNAVAIAGADVYATGAFAASATFGLGQPAQATVVAGGVADGWVGAFTTDGGFRWVRTFGSPTSCGGFGVASDDAGLAIAATAAGPLVAGTHHKALQLAPDLQLAGEGWGNVFWSAFDAAGVVAWGHNGRIGEAPCSGGGAIRGIAAASGDVVVAGSFTAHLILPSTTLAGPADLFVAVLGP